MVRRRHHDRSSLFSLPANLLGNMPPVLQLLTGLLGTQAQLGLAHPAATDAPASYQVLEPRLGAVASESDVCSRIGVDLLRAGGNAADALVGTVFCIGVIGMYHSGIGGGGFMVVRSAGVGDEVTSEVIDFRETAPAASTEDMYKENPNLSITGGLASGVPGEVRGLEYLHKKYGRLPWATVVRPAVKVARDGWTVTEDLVRYMNSATATNDFLTQDPTWAIDFAPHGYRVKLNETITRKRYADTLEVIANEGADAFYTGAIANATITALKKTGGIMTLDDLAGYQPAIREPVVINYRNYTLRSVGAPASGGVAMSILKVLEGYTDFGSPEARNLSTHRMDEAIRFGYGERTNLGDPTFITNVTDYQNAMVSEETAADIRSRISDLQSQNVSYYDPAGIESLDTPGTSHIVAADASGLSISLTTTVNLLFGSTVMVPETGIIMNNEMNDFSIPGVSNAFGFIPSPANFVRPGKRPLSSISATIVDDCNGLFYLAAGAAGGSRIITSTLQSIIHVLDEGLSVAAALAAPRLHDQLVPNQVSFEWGGISGGNGYQGAGTVGYDNATVAFMKDRGHNVTWIAPGQSSAQAIRLLPNGTWEAAGEPRQVNSGGFAV